MPRDITINTDAAITSIEIGFLPISSLNTEAGAACLNPREPEFRLDFLTTRHRDREKALLARRHPAAEQKRWRSRLR